MGIYSQIDILHLFSQGAILISYDGENFHTVTFLGRIWRCLKSVLKFLDDSWKDCRLTCIAKGIEQKINSFDLQANSVWHKQRSRIIENLVNRLSANNVANLDIKYIAVDKTVKALEQLLCKKPFKATSDIGQYENQLNNSGQMELSLNLTTPPSYELSSSNNSMPRHSIKKKPSAQLILPDEWPSGRLKMTEYLAAQTLRPYINFNVNTL
jgi:hypothetical protein